MYLSAFSIPAWWATAETVLASSPEMTLTATPWFLKYSKVALASARTGFSRMRKQRGVKDFGGVGVDFFTETGAEPKIRTRLPEEA